jgi:hypothetical protein
MTEAMALPFDDAVLILDARSVAMCGVLAMCVYYESILMPSSAITRMYLVDEKTLGATNDHVTE